MNLAASVVVYSVPAENAEELKRRVEDFLVPAAKQTAGYKGFLLLDQGEGKRMAILIYDTVEHVRNAQQALTPVGQEHTYSLMSCPAIGSIAHVLVEDGFIAPAP